MRIKKVDFEIVMFNSEFLEYYYQLIKINGEHSAGDVQLEKLNYLVKNQVVMNIKKNVKYSIFTRKYKLPKKLTKDYQLLSECIDRFSKVDMGKLIPKKYIEQEFKIHPLKSNYENQYDQLLEIMTDTYRQIKKI